MPMNWTTNSGYLSNGELNKKVQMAAQPLMKFRAFCSLKEDFGKQKGETINWLRAANVSTMGGKLVETNTMHEASQDLTWGTLSVSEYGNSIPFPYKLEALSMWDIEQIIREGLLNDMVKCIDGEVEREFNKTPLRYVGSSTTAYALTTDSTAALTNTSALNEYHVKNIIDIMHDRNIPGISQAGGDYVCIGSSLALRGIRDDIESLDKYTANGITKIYNGEIGRFNGCRFVLDTFASKYVYDSTARTATAISWSGGLSAPAYFFGEGTVREAIVNPEEIRVKIPSDYGRSKGLAWYMLGGFGIDREDHANARIVKWDSAA